MALRVGRYEALRVIASGGMATVHLGRALGVGGFERLVAIKLLHPHIASDPDAVTGFLNEARLAARIRHPNVVDMLDVQQGPEGAFLVMEYVEGPSLYRLLLALAKEDKRCPVPIALRIVLDVLAGLHAAHELTDASGSPLQLVHRDVSPQNVLVGADGISRLTDFGIAHAGSRLSTGRASQIRGKIAFMSPEQILGNRVDRRSDVYAAGVVLWEMLAGRRLFVADNDGQLVARILAGVSESLRQVNAMVPAKLEEACSRALSADLGKRYTTAAAFAEAIEDAARTAGLAVATTRSVSGFVKELRLGDPTVELDGAEPLPLEQDISLDADVGTEAPLPMAELVGEEADLGTANLGGIVPSRTIEPRRRSRLSMVGGLALLGALGAVGFMMATSRPELIGADTPLTAPATAAPTVSTAAAAPTATPTGSAAMAPSSSSSAASAAAAAPTLSARVRVGGGGTRAPLSAKPVATGVPASKPSSPSSYDPPEL